MEIILAEPAGFCYGVKRAVALAQMAVDPACAAPGRREVYTFGPIIHNPQVVEHLRLQGIRAAKGLDEIPPGSTAIIRSHGVPPEVYRPANDRGIKIVDGTCPHVRRAQKWAEKLDAQGYQVVVVGERDHPEVIGIVAWSGGRAQVVESLEEINSLTLSDKVGVLAQTTQRPDDFEAVVEGIKARVEDVRVIRTICEATGDRQEAARKLAREADVMLVVGGKSSGNTRRLARICDETGADTHLVETAVEIKSEWFIGKKRVGITAGASTPDWIIKEVLDKVQEFDNREEKKPEVEEQPKVEQEIPEPVKVEGTAPEQKGEAVEAGPTAADVSRMAEGLVPEAAEANRIAEVEAAEKDARNELEAALSVLKEGQVVKGKVVQVNQDSVLVDVGYKSEGVIYLNEWTHRPVQSGDQVAKVGDEVDVLVVSVDGHEGGLRLSKRRADEALAWERLKDVFAKGEVVEGPVTEGVKGGLVVDIGLRAFMPASQVERGYVNDLKKYVGVNVKARIIELERSKNRVILSRKVVLEEDRERTRREFWENIEEGQVRTGLVKSLTDFGSFVDLGGVDGLIHVSEMSWGRVKHPSEVLREGDEVKVKVLRLDREKGKVSLGLKQVQPDPWSLALERYPEGSVVTGRVARLATFGAFVELEPGVDGLIHISQLADRRIGKPEEVVTPGQIVRVKVTQVKPEERRISLSLREVEQDSGEEATTSPEAVTEASGEGVATE